MMRLHYFSDDSGIHSSNPESPMVLGTGDVDQKGGMFVGNRGDVTRRPIRKLPTLPSAKQAHIVNLTSLTRGGASGNTENNRKSMRTLPSLPLFGGGGTSNSSPAKQAGGSSATNWIKSARLSNFFRSVKFSR